MTDPLTGKELVLKSYEYIDKLTKECAKFLLEDYAKAHRKFELGNAAKEISSDVTRWFEKRDKNVRLSFDSFLKLQPTQFRLKFRGSTKDADFVLEGTAGLFVVPGTETTDNTIAFPKTLVLSADKSSFAKRKS